MTPGLGSSPHARGLQAVALTACPWPGIIPARAGFTVRVLVTTGFRGDHPRTRGVYVLAYQPSLTRPGSSPHARGLHESRPDRYLNQRIIPARAGFTAGRR